MSQGIAVRLKYGAIIAVLVALFPMGAAFADEQGDAQSQLTPVGQSNVSGLDLRLQAIKKDLEIFLTFAEHFISSGETKTAAQLQGPLDNYLTRHADYLVAQGADSSNIEMAQLSAEIMLIKIRLFMALNYSADVQVAVADLKKLFAPYQKITVQVLGKSTTLDEAIRQIDNDLMRTSSIKK